jgi:hypothetical protein
MDTMVVLVPSRTRPANIARLMQAWTDTEATAALVVLVDDDDPELDGYKALNLPSLIVGKRQRIGPLLNDWAPHFAVDADVVGFMGDDHCPRTVGWDQRILEASTPWTVVYGDDLFQGENIPTAVFMGSALIRELGYFNPPGCVHLFLDNAWKLYGTYLDTLTYLDDVVIEHVHYMAGKSAEDDLYREVNAPSMYEHDGRAYTEWANHQAAIDLDRVKAAMT